MRNCLFVLVFILFGGWIYWTVVPHDFDPVEFISSVVQNEINDVSDQIEESAIVSDNGDVVYVQFPQEGDFVTSPLLISGRASAWYFEGSFPVILTDWDGLIIAQGFAVAQEDWMSEGYVPFIATLEFERPIVGDTGFLILQKDNPSGLEERDDAIEIPVRFLME